LPTACADIEEIYARELARIETGLRAVGADEEADVVASWQLPAPTERQLITLPDGVRFPPRGKTPEVESHQARFRGLRGFYANKLFERAMAQVENNPTAAYQTLHHVLRENPRHEKAAKILGYFLDRSGELTRTTAKATPRSLSYRHPDFGWAPGKSWRLSTSHFQITTSHSPEAAIALGRKLEDLYDVWQQLFFLHWSSGAKLQYSFNESTPLKRPTRKHQVILFKDREEYIAQLSEHVPGIEVSKGYYAPDRKESLFYFGDEQTETTWLHEATHQLFQESGVAVERVGEHDNFWLVEGVAMYMESLRRYESWATIGGVDAERLQYARFRALHDEFYMPLGELNAMGASDLQKHEEIHRLYSQAAGIAHFLFDGDATTRNQGVDYLRRIYAGRGGKELLPSVLGKTAVETDDAYKAFLHASDADLQSLAKLPPDAAMLCLCESKITAASLPVVFRQKKLRWLDLSGVSLNAEQIRQIGAMSHLTRLSLHDCDINDASLDEIAKLKSLTSLDLSACKISDAGLSKLNSLSQLEELWLADTNITNAGLTHLEGLKSLNILDVNRTKVTRDGFEKLQSRLPQLRL